MRAFACAQSALLDRMQRLREAHPRELGAVIATIRSQGGSQRSDLVSKRFHATKTQTGLRKPSRFPGIEAGSDFINWQS